MCSHSPPSIHRKDSGPWLPAEEKKNKHVNWKNRQICTLAIKKCLIVFMTCNVSEIFFDKFPDKQDQEWGIKNTRSSATGQFRKSSILYTIIFGPTCDNKMLRDLANDYEIFVNKVLKAVRHFKGKSHLKASHNLQWLRGSHWFCTVRIGLFSVCACRLVSNWPGVPQLVWQACW